MCPCFLVSEIPIFVVYLKNLLKAGPVLKAVPFRNRGKNLAEGNRGPGLYSRKYGINL